jgi:hypothetical protein
MALNLAHFVNPIDIDAAQGVRGGKIVIRVTGDKIRG